MASTSTPLAIPSDRLTGNAEVLPDFVITAVLAAMPDGRLLAAPREDEGDDVSYEVLVENGEGVFAIDVSADGIVRDIEPAGTEEHAISASDLPQLVRAAVEATVPGSRITKAVRELVRDRVIYDVEVDVRGRKFDLEIAEDGIVLKVEDPDGARWQTEYIRVAEDLKREQRTTGGLTSFLQYRVANRWWTQVRYDCYGLPIDQGWEDRATALLAFLPHERTSVRFQYSRWRVDARHRGFNQYHIQLRFGVGPHGSSYRGCHGCQA